MWKSGAGMTRRLLSNENVFTAGKAAEIAYAGVEKAIGDFFHALGFNYENDPQLKDTPKRVRKMFVEELFSGCYIPEPKFTIFPNTRKYNQMIVLKNVRIVSTCSHHLKGFRGCCSIGYIPSSKGNICGISKLARIVRWFSRRPQIQEELTKQIAAYIWKKLKPLGVMIVIEASHACMTDRGVEEVNSSMVTSEVLGVFKTRQATREEFLRLIGK